jgi:hypothetical protein
MPGRHPLDWRREVMVMTKDGEVCSICGWCEDTEDSPKIHEAHIAGSSRFQVNNAGREPEIVDVTRRR